MAEYTSSSSSTSDELGFDEIMQELVARAEGTMLKSILKKHTIVDSLDSNVLTLIVINEQFFNTVQKPEINDNLQKITSEII